MNNIQQKPTKRSASMPVYEPSPKRIKETPYEDMYPPPAPRKVRKWSHIASDQKSKVAKILFE